MIYVYDITKAVVYYILKIIVIVACRYNIFIKKKTKHLF